MPSHPPAAEPPTTRTTARHPLKVYSDRSWLLPGRGEAHVTLLCAFWGRTTLGAAGWPDYADRLIESGHEFLESTALEEAELAVFPSGARLFKFEPELIERAHEFADVARAARRRPVFFFEPTDTQGYIDPPFPVDDAIVVRGSIFRSRRSPNEFALPGFHEDLLSHTGGELPLRVRSEHPIVSFCGGVIREHEPGNALARLRRVPGAARHALWRLRGQHEEDLFVRARAVDALLAQEHVRTSIVVRDSGGGGNWNNFDPARWRTARHEFVDNMVASDYVLCARGDGNWSLRFYESLSLGRIPVVVDTDLVLPFDFLVPWRDYCVWLARSDVSRIGEKVAEFHERLGASEFQDLQRECRLLWERYLCPVGFFRHFPRYLDAPAAAPTGASDAGTA